jgi:N-acetylglucosamine kinase-like BadF-type ATPase
MILIGDSGSTKTDWRLIDGQDISILQCNGLNPNTCNDKLISATISDLLLDYPSISKVYFFGAGCGSVINQERMRVLFSHFFVNAEINIHSDMLGASIATKGSEKGLVAILGTGSNICFYDGKEISQKNRSLGYLLGDEGGGSYLGKLFLTLYLSDQLDSSICEKMKKSPAEIMDELYSSTSPNRYMASYCPFIFRNRSHPQISSIICENFIAFFEKYAFQYDEKEISFCGSLAYYFNSELKHVANQFSFNVSLVLEKPIAALTLFYKVD